MSSDAIYFAGDYNDRRYTHIYVSYTKSFPFFGATIPRASSTGEIASSGSFDASRAITAAPLEINARQFGILQIPILPLSRYLIGSSEPVVKFQIGWTKTQLWTRRFYIFFHRCV